MLFLLKQRPRIWRIFSIFIAFIGGFLLVVLTIVKSGIIGIQLMLDASTLPAILNAKSMKPFADKVVSTVPNGEIYSYVESSMMRFFIINFYAQNRVIDFEKEMPKNGYLLVGERDFNYIKEKYGEQYTFEQTLRSDRKGNDVKDYILLFNFQQNTAE